MHHGRDARVELLEPGVDPAPQLIHAGQQLGLVLLISLGIALAVTFYAGRLENRLHQQQAREIQNSKDLQQLSAKLLKAQEEERRTIARELVRTVRSNVTIDWTVRENVRAQLRVLVKRILRKYGYPPDRQERATQTVLEQAALLSSEWAAASSRPSSKGWPCSTTARCSPASSSG